MASRIINKKSRSVSFTTGILLFFFMNIKLVADSHTSPNIRLHNIPGGVEFYVNGITKSPDKYGVIPVSPGTMLLEIKKNRVVVYSASFLFDSTETKTITFNCSMDCALLHVITEPAGATLSMNGNILGVTPYMNRFVKPGSYSIMVTSPGYFPVIRRIDLTLKSDIESYIMEQTRAARDSLGAIRKSMQRKRQIRNGALFGLAGAGMSAAGVYYEWKAYTKLKRMGIAGERYDDASNEKECEKQKRIYYDNREDAKRPILYRNIFYGAAGLCVAGLYVSFLF